MIKVNILWAGKTGDSNAWYHIYPFVVSKFVNKVDVIRTSKPNRIIPQVQFYTFSCNNKVIELGLFVFQLFVNLFRFQYDIVVSFNHYQWGIITFFISKLFRKKRWV